MKLVKIKPESVEDMYSYVICNFVVIRGHFIICSVTLLY